MAKPLVCLCLTGKTLAEDVEIVNEYINYIDLVELRADFLEDNERLNIKDFPSMIDIPCILTIRRKIDGGQYLEGEASRTTLFARALSFANRDSKKNFAYVDFEDDFRVASLQDEALAFGTKIIRSFHDMNAPVKNIVERLNAMRYTGFEIPKIAFMPHSLNDITDLFAEADALKDSQQIICAMSNYGLPSRLLAAKLHSFLTFTSPRELLDNLNEIGHIDPITINHTYKFRKINENTKVFGITGFPLKVTSSPEMHNGLFEVNKMDAVFIPFKADTVEDAFNFAKGCDVKGFSVTIPHKENIIKMLDRVDAKVEKIGACNTVINNHGIWEGYNTDCTGIAKALLEFTGLKNLKHKKVAIIGAGGASRAVTYAIKELGAKACVFNRTIEKARDLANIYGFDYASLGPESREKLHQYSDIIVQTTSKGMGCTGVPTPDNDPIYFYDFDGHEMIYDIVYAPSVTPVMARAHKAGCNVCNGLSMLKYQGDAQFALYKEIYEQS